MYACLLQSSVFLWNILYALYNLPICSSRLLRNVGNHLGNHRNDVISNSHTQNYYLTSICCTVLSSTSNRNMIEFNNCPTRCDLFSLLYFCRQLYMFRELLNSITRKLGRTNRHNTSKWHVMSDINTMIPWSTTCRQQTQKRNQTVNVGVVHRYRAQCNRRHQWKQAANKQKRNNRNKKKLYLNYCNEQGG